MFFSGGLELSYPDLDVHSCLIIPKKFRKKITQEWRPPQVWLTTADKVSGLKKHKNMFYVEIFNEIIEELKYTLQEMFRTEGFETPGEVRTLFKMNNSNKLKL